LVEGKMEGKEKNDNSTIDIKFWKNELDSKPVIYGNNHYIPVLLMMENDGAQWILVELDTSNQEIVIYNPQQGNNEYEEEISRKIKKILEQKDWRVCWGAKRCTTFCKQKERNDSGVFIAKWIMNVAEKRKNGELF